MRIQRILAYRVELPLHEGSYKWSGGKSVVGLRQHDRRASRPTRAWSATARSARSGRSTCRRTPPGRAPGSPSWGRTCSARIRCQLGRAQPSGWTPRFKGHPYVKSAIDIACWDILGKATGQPVCVLLGGRYGEDFVLYRAISQEAPEAMAGGSPAIAPRAIAGSSSRSAATRSWTSSGSAPVAAELQPGDRLVADANTGWLMHEALRVVRAVRDVDVYIEQPCLSYEECLDRPPPLRSSVRPRRGHRLARRAAARPRRPGDGRGEPQDQQARRPDQGPAGARPVRLAGHRHDDRGQLGRRHHHRRHRPPGAQHAARVALHRRPTSTATSPSARPRVRRSARAAGCRPRRRPAWASSRGWTCWASRSWSSNKKIDDYPVPGEPPPMNGRNAMLASVLIVFLGSPLLAQEPKEEGKSHLTVERIFQHHEFERRGCLGALAARRLGLHDLGRLEGDARRPGPGAARPGHRQGDDPRARRAPDPGRGAFAAVACTTTSCRRTAPGC